MLNTVIHFIDQHNLIQSGSTIVVGLSGGPDSVCLLHILCQLRRTYALTLIAAHIDDECRPSSGEEALFCRNFAQSLAVPFREIKASESPVKKNLGSHEDFGRRIRRVFFEEVAHQSHADSIALAHHVADQQETFFVRMIRGASISGLASIRPRHGLYIRPLLSVTKEAILDYLVKEGLSYCIDSSNTDDTYLRNALRAHVIPALKQCDPRFEKNFNSSLTHIQETELFLERVAQKAFDRITTISTEGRSLHLDHFFQEDSFLHHRLILKWLCTEKARFTPSTALFNEIIRFFKAEGSKHQLSNHWFIEKHQKRAVLKKSSLAP